MEQFDYSPLKQYKVLKAIENQCGLFGDKPILLEVSEVEGPDISRYCKLLCELEYIKTVTFKDKSGDVCIPISLTSKGMKILSETEKNFWQYAESVALDAAKHWVGFDLENTLKFFKNAYTKYKNEENNS